MNSLTSQQPPASAGRLSLEQIIQISIAAETRQICEEEGEMAARRVKERIKLMAERVSKAVVSRFEIEGGMQQGLSVKVTYREETENGQASA
jgi:hypothetical protein